MAEWFRIFALHHWGSWWTNRSLGRFYSEIPPFFPATNSISHFLQSHVLHFVHVISYAPIILIHIPHHPSIHIAISSCTSRIASLYDPGPEQLALLRGPTFHIKQDQTLKMVWIRMRNKPVCNQPGPWFSQVVGQPVF